MRQYVRFSSLRQLCINLWNVAGVLHSPKGMQSHSRSPNYQKLTWCTVLMTHPSWFARPQTLGLGMKNGQHLQSSPAPPGSLAVGRNLSLCGCWDGRNLCKSIGPHHSFQSTPLHYTMHSGWGELHLNPTSLTSEVWASSTNSGGIHPSHSLNGASSVTLIMCLVEGVSGYSQVC